MRRAGSDPLNMSSHGGHNAVSVRLTRRFHHPAQNLMKVGGGLKPNGGKTLHRRPLQRLNSVW